MSPALRRVEAFVKLYDGRSMVLIGTDGSSFAVRDLVKVLALARRAEGLERRVKLARGELRPTGYVRPTQDLLDVLNLRRPLPKRRRGR